MIGFAAHGVDVRDGVGGRDAAEIMRVVDHRHEEVGGGDDAGILVLLPDGSVVCRLIADQQLLVGMRGGLIGQKLL